MIATDFPAPANRAASEGARLAGADDDSVVLLTHDLSVLCQAEDTE
jgi:hypothetical protein